MAKGLHRIVPEDVHAIPHLVYTESCRLKDRILTSARMHGMGSDARPRPTITGSVRWVTTSLTTKP